MVLIRVTLTTASIISVLALAAFFCQIVCLVQDRTLRPLTSSHPAAFVEIDVLRGTILTSSTTASYFNHLARFRPES